MELKESVWLNELIKIRDVLNNLNYDYFLDTGTLLGAIRDQAFIPWDSDMDLGIKVKQLPLLTDIQKLSEALYESGFNVTATSYCLFLWAKNGKASIGIYFYYLYDNQYITYLYKLIGSKFYVHLYTFLSKVIVYKRGYSTKFNLIGTFYSLKNNSLKDSYFMRFLEKKCMLNKKYVCIPEMLLENLKEIDFYNERFLVPGLPEDYLECRYGITWKTPIRDYNDLRDDQSLADEI